MIRAGLLVVCLGTIAAASAAQAADEAAQMAAARAEAAERRLTRLRVLVPQLPSKRGQAPSARVAGERLLKALAQEVRAWRAAGDLADRTPDTADAAAQARLTAALQKASQWTAWTHLLERWLQAERDAVRLNLRLSGGGRQAQAAARVKQALSVIRKTFAATGAALPEPKQLAVIGRRAGARVQQLSALQQLAERLSELQALQQHVDAQHHERLHAIGQERLELAHRLVDLQERRVELAAESGAGPERQELRTREQQCLARGELLEAQEALVRLEVEHAQWLKSSPESLRKALGPLRSKINASKRLAAEIDVSLKAGDVTDAPTRRHLQGQRTAHRQKAEILSTLLEPRAQLLALGQQSALLQGDALQDLLARARDHYARLEQQTHTAAESALQAAIARGQAERDAAEAEQAKARADVVLREGRRASALLVEIRDLLQQRGGAGRLRARVTQAAARLRNEGEGLEPWLPSLRVAHRMLAAAADDAERGVSAFEKQDLLKAADVLYDALSQAALAEELGPLLRFRQRMERAIDKRHGHYRSPDLSAAVERYRQANAQAVQAVVEARQAAARGGGWVEATLAAERAGDNARLRRLELQQELTRAQQQDRTVPGIEETF
jgi:hypothetical protein